MGGVIRTWECCARTTKVELVAVCSALHFARGRSRWNGESRARRFQRQGAARSDASFPLLGIAAIFSSPATQPFHYMCFAQTHPHHSHPHHHHHHHHQWPFQDRPGLTEVFSTPRSALARTSPMLLRLHWPNALAAFSSLHPSQISHTP